jgi:hypothetical protein
MLIIPILAAVAVLGQSQDTTLADLLAGKSVPTEISAKQLPAGFSAVEIQVAGGGGGGLDSFLSSPFLIMGALMRGDNSPSGPPPDAIAALTAVWTAGLTLRIDGSVYYVTYGYSLTDAVSATEPPSVLKLKLIRVDSVTSLRPLGNLSPDLSALSRPTSTNTEAELPYHIPTPTADMDVGTAPAPFFISEEQAISSEGRAARLSAMKSLLLRTEVVLGSTKNVFPFVQSTASMYGVLGHARGAATSPAKFYEIAASPRGGVRFVFNMSLAGVDSTTVGNNASVPIWYEQDPDLDGNRVVGLLNGSTRLVNTAEWSAHYAALIRKNYSKAKGQKPLPPNHMVADLPNWLKG